ncbi:hypothetical protein ACTIVE_5379 [Actinomadura verrucosospora]|uniref:Uncharacterized protein n=1 Tax=Actinomadura verrucosospora TaxID=46165 RepID=A0A7D3W0V5_ACTVE|nr:hypothetical protein ACTIVE_5379 [Actinomadura verrucosospora]
MATALPLQLCTALAVISARAPVSRVPLRRPPLAAPGAQRPRFGDARHARGVSRHVAPPCPRRIPPAGRRPRRHLPTPRPDLRGPHRRHRQHVCRRPDPHSPRPSLCETTALRRRPPHDRPQPLAPSLRQRRHVLTFNTFTDGTDPTGVADQISAAVLRPASCGPRRRGGDRRMTAP